MIKNKSKRVINSLLDLDLYKLTMCQLAFLIFRESFLGFLKNLQLSGLNIEDDGESYKITAQGSWPEVTLWETLILSVVNELYYRRILQKMSRAERKDLFAEGQRRLEEIIQKCVADCFD